MNTKTDFTKEDFQKQQQRIIKLMEQWQFELIRENCAPICLVSMDNTGMSLVQMPDGIDAGKIIRVLRETANNIDSGSKVKMIQ